MAKKPQTLKEKIAARNELLGDTSLIGKQATKKKVAKKVAKKKALKKRPY